MKLRDKHKKGAFTKEQMTDDEYFYDDENDGESFEDDDAVTDELVSYKGKRSERHKKKKVRRARIVTLILFLLLVALVGLNWNVLAPPKLAQSLYSFINSFGKSKYPVTFTQGSMKTGVPLGSDVGVLTDTSFLIYSQTGDLLAARPHGFSNPAAVSGGGDAIIFDRGGKQFRVETRFSEPYTASATNAITTAAAGESGNFAIVTESQDYLSELTVYNTSYKNVFEWDASQSRVLSAALSPDGSKLAAIAVGARDGSIFSDIYIFNLNSQNPVAVKKYDGELLYSISFKDNNEIAAVGQDETAFLDSSGKQTSLYTYDDKQLICSANADGPVVLVFGGVNNLSSVISLDGGGNLQGKADINADVKTVCTGGGNIVFSSHGLIWHGSNNCADISKISESGDVLASLSTKNYAYIFSMQSVQRLNLH